MEVPKISLKFPEFDVDNLSFWIRRCNSYFQLCRIPDHLKMPYVSLNIKGKAEYWYECYVSELSGVVTWDKFCVDICRRFGAEPMDLMGKFTSVKQSGDMDVEEYLGKFEEAMSDVVSAYPDLQKAFYVANFIGGLKPDIKSVVGIKPPTTILDAFQKAKLHEKYLTEHEKKEDHGRCDMD